MNQKYERLKDALNDAFKVSTVESVEGKPHGLVEIKLRQNPHHNEKNDKIVDFFHGTALILKNKIEVETWYQDRRGYYGTSYSQGHTEHIVSFKATEQILDDIISRVKNDQLRKAALSEYDAHKFPCKGYGCM